MKTVKNALKEKNWCNGTISRQASYNLDGTGEMGICRGGRVEPLARGSTSVCVTRSGRLQGRDRVQLLNTALNKCLCMTPRQP